MDLDQLLADVGDLVDQLDRNSTVFADMDLDTLADVMQATRAIHQQLGDVVREATQTLADMMAGPQELTERYRLVRSQANTTQWDADDARAAIVDKLCERYAIDPLTGEMRPGIAKVLRDALRSAFAAVSSAPRASLTAGGLNALGIDPDEFRSFKRGAYSVKVLDRATDEAEAS
jgi:hypothetical protein